MANLSIPECISIIQKIEAEYKTWTTVQLVDNIRHISPLDSALFQLLFGSDAGISFNPKGKYTTANEADLIATLTHKIDPKNFAETGISLDINSSRSISLGHVLTGISAGLYHDNLLAWSQRVQPLRSSAIKVPQMGPIPGFTLIPALGPYKDRNWLGDEIYTATVA